MADDLDLDLDLVDDQDRVNKSEKRIKDLSEKVKTTAEERDAERKAKADEEAKRIAAEKDRDFFKDFSTSTAKYPGAAEYQDQIREKVLAGYDVEDATISILAREGRYTPQAPTPVAPPKDFPAGGSAVNTIRTGGEKSLGEMTRDEKLQALREAESKGDLSIS
jgi:hypothetical protein